MSYRQERLIQWGVWIRTFDYMDIETKELIADLLVSVILALLAWEGGAQPTITVACISIVHSVHIPRAIRAYREAKYQIPLDEADE